jgi:TatD DNase family protein
MVWTTIGVHPHQAAEPIETHITVERLVTLANSHSKIVAIGECGLDYYYDFAPRDVQKRGFKTHIEAALETGLPIIIHAREADEDMISILNGYKGQNLRGIMHCFSSTQRLADTALELGFMLSFSGIVTFPKSHLLHEICRSIPLRNILIETDAPYLAPDPYRGKRNEPSFVSNIGYFIAKLHKIDESQLMNETNNNFFTLFNKILR